MEERERKSGAKEQSRMAMLFASAWIGSLTILHGLDVIKIDVQDIIYSGIAIVAVWSPTYLSVWLDKIRDIRFGKQ